jgi:hypothetical protein
MLCGLVLRDFRIVRCFKYLDKPSAPDNATGIKIHACVFFVIFEDCCLGRENFSDRILIPTVTILLV